MAHHGPNMGSRCAPDAPQPEELSADLPEIRGSPWAEVTSAAGGGCAERRHQGARDGSAVIALPGGRAERGGAAALGAGPAAARWGGGWIQRRRCARA